MVAPTPETLPTIDQGSMEYPQDINTSSALLEVLCRYAFGGYCVLEGLTVSAVGLLVTVAVGFAAIDGIVPLRSVRTTSVSASQLTVNIWLKQDGTVTSTNDATPPAGKVLYIGQVTTDGSGVVSQTYDGVVYGRGGSLYRTLAAPPADSPPSTMRLWTQVGNDLYFWNGTVHKQVTLV